MWGLHVKRRWRKWKTSRALIPKPLPERRRALSVNRPDSGMGDLGKLPYEIRHMIYVYVLGHQIIHIDNSEYLPNRLGHTRCFQISQFHHHRHDEFDKSGNGKMALLKTCHAIYIEAVGLLYATNTFALYGQTRQIEAFLYFCASIRPWRLASITDLQLSYVEILDGDLQFSSCWNRLWDEIATGMTGLEHLTLRLSLASRLPLSLDEVWVKPMLQVRGVKMLDFRLHGIRGQWTKDYESEMRSFQKRLGEQMCAERGTPRPRETENPTGRRIR
jgi:hypothetical protein